MVKISILLPSFKHVKWVHESIESVLAQTYKDFELLIVDDCSNDGSADIIKEYAAKDSRIKYQIFKKNQGAVKATKACYDMASGEYIAIMSSDDLWLEDKLERQIKFLEENKNIGAVFGLPKFIGPDGAEFKPRKNEFLPSLEPKTRSEWMQHLFKKGNCLCHPTVLIRKECYETVGFYNQVFRNLPDYDMWVRLCFKYDIAVLNEEFIKFRKHDFNESVASVATHIRAFTENKQILQHFLEAVTTVTDLESIFPDESFPVKDDRLVPFYWAQLALKKGTPYSVDFAFDLLYLLLEGGETTKLIEGHELYSIHQLAADAVHYNIYNISAEKIILKIPSLLSITVKKDAHLKIIKLSFFKKWHRFIKIRG